MGHDFWEKMTQTKLFNVHDVWIKIIGNNFMSILLDERSKIYSAASMGISIVFFTVQTLAKKY